MVSDIVFFYLFWKIFLWVFWNYVYGVWIVWRIFLCIELIELCVCVFLVDFSLLNFNGIVLKFIFRSVLIFVINCISFFYGLLFVRKVEFLSNFLILVYELYIKVYIIYFDNYENCVLGKKNCYLWFVEW